MSGFGPARSYNLSLGYAFTLVPNQPYLTAITSNDPNVLFLHFSDLKKDLKKEVTRIAQFLDLPLTEERLAITLEKASYPYMKKNNHKFLIHLGKNFDIKAIEVRVNTGLSDKGANFFTPEMSAKWEAAVQTHFGDDPQLLQWAADGGGF